jgi:hypothetical protein
VVKTFQVALLILKHLPLANPANCERQARRLARQTTELKKLCRWRAVLAAAATITT